MFDKEVYYMYTFFMTKEQVALLITHRNSSPMGIWDEIVVVSPLEALSLKFEYGDDCFNLTDLLEN